MDSALDLALSSALDPALGSAPAPGLLSALGSAPRSGSLPWSRQGRQGQAAARGAPPQCLLSNHLLPRARNRERTNRAGLLWEALPARQARRGKHIHLRVSWPEMQFHLLAFSWRRLRAHHNSPGEPDAGEPAAVPGQRSWSGLAQGDGGEEPGAARARG